MSSLFIVESPGKVEKIQHILDDLYPHEFVVRASVGHVCDLPNHEIGFSCDPRQGCQRNTRRQAVL